ncbi:MAG: hypothetical protein V3W06_08385, partial [Acidimicrobiia bacterium]
RFWENISLDSESNALDRNYFDFRGRMGVDAKLSEGVRVRLELERLQNFGSQQPNDANLTTPRSITDSSGDTASVSDNGGVWFRQAWMDFQVPGLPEGWRMQAGRSFFQVGHGFVYGNSLTGDDGATLYGPLGDGTLKIRFSQPGSNADAGTCCIGAVGGGGDVYYVMLDYKMEVAEKQNVELYGIAGWDKGIGAVATGTTKADGGSLTSNEFWVGGAYSGVAGPLAIKAEAAYQGGTARSDALNPATGVGAVDIDRSAGFAWLDVTYKIIPAWSVSLDMSFATGDGNATDDTHNNFVSPLALVSTSPTRTWTDSGFFFGNRTGRSIGNAVTNRSYNIWGRGTEDLDSAATLADDGSTPFSPGLLLLKFKTKYVFNPQVTGFLEIIPAWAAKSPQVGVSDISSYLGTEVDVKVSYKPYPSILMNGYFGYFEPGGFYDQGGALLATPKPTGRTAGTDAAFVFRGVLYAPFYPFHPGLRPGAPPRGGALFLGGGIEETPRLLRIVGPVACEEQESVSRKEAEDVPRPHVVHCPGPDRVCRALEHVHPASRSL